MAQTCSALCSRHDCAYSSASARNWAMCFGRTFVRSVIWCRQLVPEAMTSVPGAWFSIASSKRWPTCTDRSYFSANAPNAPAIPQQAVRSEEHTSELQSLTNLVCRLLLEKKKKKKKINHAEESNS